MSVEEGSLVWLVAQGDRLAKRRPGVVLKVLDGVATVAYFTSQDQTAYQPTFKVECKTRAGKALRLDFDSWVSRTLQFKPVRLLEERQPAGKCPGHLLDQIRCAVMSPSQRASTRPSVTAPELDVATALSQAEADVASVRAEIDRKMPSEPDEG